MNSSPQIQSFTHYVTISNEYYYSAHFLLITQHAPYCAQSSVACRSVAYFFVSIS